MGVPVPPLDEERIGRSAGALASPCSGLLRRVCSGGVLWCWVLCGSGRCVGVEGVWWVLVLVVAVAVQMSSGGEQSQVVTFQDLVD